jgi:hypothetical protein
MDKMVDIKGKEVKPSSSKRILSFDEFVSESHDYTVNEGNAIFAARAKAIQEERDEFVFNGKTYKVTTSTKSINEAEIISDDEFKEYVNTVLKKAFGEDFDQAKADEVADGSLKVTNLKDIYVDKGLVQNDKKPVNNLYSQVIKPVKNTVTDRDLDLIAGSLGLVKVAVDADNEDGFELKSFDYTYEKEFNLDDLLELNTETVSDGNTELTSLFEDITYQFFDNSLILNDIIYKKQYEVPRAERTKDNFFYNPFLLSIYFEWFCSKCNEYFVSLFIK